MLFVAGVLILCMYAIFTITKHYYNLTHNAITETINYDFN